MGERISRRVFIRLGTALGVGATGASVLTACGGGESASGGAGNGSGGGVSSTGSSDGQAIARASEVAPGSAVEFQDSGQPAVLVRLEDGELVAYSAVCTHQQCTVAYKDGQLVCPCHGSIFDPANGAQVVSGPAPRPLPEIPVEVRDGEISRA